MGKDCGSWQRRYPWQSPNFNYLSIPPDLGQQDIAHSMAYPLYASHCSVSANRTATGHALPENYARRSFGGNELQGWSSYYYPQHTLTSTPKSMTGENFYVSQCGEAACNQKGFLIFDQSENRTSLVFSSVGYPFQRQFPSSLQQCDANANVSNVALPVNKDANIHDPVEKGGYFALDEKHETHVSAGSGSEMHEDTEEIDALLYSDDDDDDDEDETSTGHSPSEMTGYEKKEAKDDDSEVASSVTPTKRKRLEVEHEQALRDTASSRRELNWEGDALSSCTRGETSEGSSPSKRLRRERIRETVGILSSIIPGGKRSKDAIAVLDEAIRYLKSMRLKAKALGAAATFM